MEVVTGRYRSIQVDPATWPAAGKQLQLSACHWLSAATVTFATGSQLEHMSAGGGEFETPPPSPNYSPQPSDDEDEENISVAGDDQDGIGWWADDEIEQRELERQERCIRLANQAHIDLIHALPEDICPTLTAVLEYTEWISLGDWHLFESDVHAQARIVEHFLVSQENN